MTTARETRLKPQPAAGSFLHNLRRALAHPRRAVDFARRWTLLAMRAELPCAELLRYRRELMSDRGFQGHLERGRREVHYVMPETVELYAIVRAIKPRVMVETGVASGLSSAHILKALDRNGFGRLHSIDLPNVQEGSILPEGRASGWMVPDALRGRWELRLGDSRKVLPELLESLGCVDAFLHDSDHTYAGMMFEFETAYPWLEPGGILMSDDTHLHGAWDDFCSDQGLRPGRVGRLGVARKPMQARRGLRQPDPRSNLGNTP